MSPSCSVSTRTHAPTRLTHETLQRLRNQFFRMSPSCSVSTRTVVAVVCPHAGQTKCIASMHKIAEQGARKLLEVASTAGAVRSADTFAIAGARGFASNKTSTGPHGGSGSSPNTSKDNPPPQSPMEQSMEVSPEVPQHEAADMIPNQVPNQLGGERFPDALESDTTFTNVPDKALPKEKAS